MKGWRTETSTGILNKTGSYPAILTTPNLNRGSFYTTLGLVTKNTYTGINLCLRIVYISLILLQFELIPPGVQVTDYRNIPLSKTSEYLCVSLLPLYYCLCLQPDYDDVPNRCWWSLNHLSSFLEGDTEVPLTLGRLKN